MVLVARPQPHIYRSPWDRAFSVVQRRRLSSSASCKPCVAAAAAAAAAAAGEPGSRGVERGGPVALSSSGISRRGSSSRRSSSSRSTDEEDAVAAVLASVGLDPAELQRQAPAVYSQLNPAVAQVLAEVHLDRVVAAKGGLHLPHAKLMARICFLALEVGLTAGDIREGHRRDQGYIFFSVDGARRVHSWLLSEHLSTDQLRLASRNNTRLWSTNAGSLQRYKEHVQQRLSVTDSQWRKLFITRSQSLLGSPERVDRVIAWLEAEPLGLSRAEVTKLWLSFPVLFSLPAALLQHRLGQLVSRFSLSEASMRQVVLSSSSVLARPSAVILSQLDSLLAAAPCLRASIPWLLCKGGGSVLGYSAETVLTKVDFLREYGFDEGRLSKIFSRSPMVLLSSVEDKLKLTLTALEDVLGSQAGVVAAVAQEPGLLVAPMETLEGNVGVMGELGLGPEDIKESVAKDPLLFAYNFTHQDFQDKLRYFEEVLGRSPRHMLVVEPYRLRSALKKVDYRVSFMERKGDKHHEATLTWIPWSSERFCRAYGYDLGEFEKWREQWVHSERARQYGLDKAKEPGIVRAQRARMMRFRAKVDASRERVLGAGEE